MMPVVFSRHPSLPVVVGFLFACAMTVANAALLVWKGNLYLHFKPARAKQRGVEHVEAVCHANQQNVVQSVHTVNL